MKSKIFIRIPFFRQSTLNPFEILSHFYGNTIVSVLLDKSSHCSHLSGACGFWSVVIFSVFIKKWDVSILREILYLRRVLLCILKECSKTLNCYLVWHAWYVCVLLAQESGIFHCHSYLFDSWFGRSDDGFI